MFRFTSTMSNRAIALGISLTLISQVIAVGGSIPASADGNGATEDLSSTCTTASASTPQGLVQSGVQAAVPGETVSFQHTIAFAEGDIYQDIFTRPDGSDYVASYIETISLPSDLILDDASPRLEINEVAASLTAGSEPHPTEFVLETDTSTAGTTVYRVLFPGDVDAQTTSQSGAGVLSYSVPVDGETFVFSFDVQVPSSTSWGTVLEGAECFASISTGPSNRDTDRSRSAVSTIIPEIDLDKSTDPANAYQAGSDVSYTLTASVAELGRDAASLLVAPARDVVIVDNLPGGSAPLLLPLDDAGDLVTDGGLTAGGGRFNANAGTVTYDAGDVAPGDTWSTTETMRITPGTPATTDIINTATAVISYLPGNDNPNDTIVDPAATADALVTVASGSPTVTKESDVDRYGVGLPITYSVAIDLPAGSSYENLTISDRLPDALRFGDYVGATCLPAGPTCPTEIESLAVTEFSGGGTVIGWYPNSVPPAEHARQFVFTYTASIDSHYGDEDPVAFLDEFTNNAAVHWNTVDRLGDVAPSTAALPNYDGTTETNKVVVFDRPVLEIDKVGDTSDGDHADRATVAWDYQPGDTVDYSVLVRNIGSRPATNLTFSDVAVGIGIDLGSVRIDGEACASCAINAEGELNFNLAGPLAAGDSITLSYQAEPTDTGLLLNTVSIPTYEDDLGTAYKEAPADEVTFSTPDPVLSIEKSAPSDAPLAYGTSTGTEIHFSYAVTNTGQATAYNATVTDLPPAGTCNLAGTLGSQPGISESAPGVWVLDEPLDPGETFDFDANIEVCDNIDAGIFINEVELAWEDVGDGFDQSGEPYRASSDEPFELVLPEYAVEKSPAVDAGATINFTLDETNPNEGAWIIRVTNTGLIPTGGLVVDDTMPESFEYLPGDASVVWIGQGPASFDDDSTASATAILPGRTATLQLVLGQLEPGASARITVPFAHNGISPEDGVFSKINTVKVTNSNIDFDPDLHEAQGEYTILPVEKGPGVSKTVSPTAIFTGDETVEAAPGAERYFHLDVTLPGDSINPANPLTAHDLMIQDFLPDGLNITTPTPTYGQEGPAQPSGWNVTCIGGACESGAPSDQAEFAGAFLGSSSLGAGRTQLLWWFGDYTNAADSVYRITMPVTVNQEFNSGLEVIDGVNEPLINSARPLFNRDLDAGSGASGDVFSGLPATAPSPRDDFDRAYPKDTAKIDISTPRLDIEKQGFDSDGNPVSEVEVGEVIDYEIIVTNTGSGPAFDIEIADNLGRSLGLNRMDIDEASLSSSPAGVSCSIVNPSPSLQALTCSYNGAPTGLAGDPDGFSGPLSGDQIRITYSATSLPSSQLISPASTQNHDADIIRNVVRTPVYYEVPGPHDASHNEYSTGRAVVRTLVFTPVAELEVQCHNEVHNVGVGDIAQWGVYLGNGDWNRSGDDKNAVFSPAPRLDVDDDGDIDNGIGYAPSLRLVLPDFYLYQSTVASGPGPQGGDDPTYTTYVSFPDPDSITDNGDGTQTWEWDPGTIADIPPSPNNYHQDSFKPEYHLIIDAVKSASGPAWLEGEMAFQDASGSQDRGTDSDEPFTYDEYAASGCPGPGPGHHVYKEPDIDDGVQILPGEVKEFTVTLSTSRDTVSGNRFVDHLPHGLEFVGDPGLDGVDADYTEATISPVPDGWTSLEDYFVSAITAPDGETDVIWESLPDLPEGSYTLTIPVRGIDPPPYPNDWLTNVFEWQSDQGNRDDPGNMYSIPRGNPTIEKRVDKEAAAYGSEFTFTLEVTIPAAYEANDVTIRDYINYGTSWSPAGLSWGSTDVFPNGSLDRYDKPPSKFVRYDSANCVIGCSDIADTIEPFGLEPLPLVEYGDPAISDPRTAAIYYHSSQNNAVGWYLGDIAQDPEGQDRVIELVYTIETPTLEQVREVIATRAASRVNMFPGGAEDEAFDTEPWLTRLSEMHHLNLVILDDHGMTQDPWFDQEINLEDSTQWWREMGTNNVANDYLSVAEAYPIVKASKECLAINGDAQPDLTPLGTPNVKCTLTLTNTTPVSAYNVQVTDTPDTQCGKRLFHNDGWWHSGNWGNYDCEIGAETVPNHPHLQTPPNQLPATWVAPEILPNDSVKYDYSLRVNGWDSKWDAYGGFRHDYEHRGSWGNNATVSPWFDAEFGGQAIGEEHTARDIVGFTDAHINVFKFPFVQHLEDVRPFNAEHLRDSGEAKANNLSLADPYDWAYQGLNWGEDWDDPWAGAWMEGASTTDRLEPPRVARSFHLIWPQIARSLHRYAYPHWTHNSWTYWNSRNYDANPAYASYLAHDDPDNWSEEYYAWPDTTRSWAIDVFTKAPERLEQVTIADQLPYGWAYKPGSARLIEGDWLLEASGFKYASSSGVTTGYEEIALPDPIIDSTTSVGCSARNLHENGATLTWQFLRDTPGQDQFWDYRYVDANDWERDTGNVSDFEPGEMSSVNTHLLIFDTIPALDVLSCDPDPTSADPFFMENNVTISAVRDYTGEQITDRYAQIVPVPNPVSLSKTPDAEFIQDDSDTEFTVTFTNNLDVAVEHITIHDDLQIVAGVAPQPGSGYTCGTATAEGGTDFAEATCNLTGSTSWELEWSFSSVAPGEQVVITMPIHAPVDEANALRYENTASTTVKEWYDTELSDDGLVTVINPSPPQTPTKSSTPNPATINDIVTYNVGWTAQATQIFADLAYIDTVPAGLTFIDYDGVTCQGGCPSGFSAADVVAMPPVANADGTTTLMWWFGNMPGSATAHNWRASYKVRVDGEWPNRDKIVDGDQVTNTVIGYANEESLLDEPSSVIHPSSWTTYPPSAPTSEDLLIKEPTLAIEKEATPSTTPTDGSSTIVYSVHVTNTSEMPAYAVEISDLPSGALENIKLDNPTYPDAVVTAGWTPIAPEVSWFIPILAPGETATFTYLAEVADDFLSEGFPTADNNASVERFRARGGLEPEPDDRIYTPELRDTTSTPLVSPEIRLEKTIGVDCAEESKFVEPDVAVTWCLNIFNDGSAPAYGLAVSDTLPFKWTYLADSTTGSNWAVPVAEPDVTELAARVEHLVWTVGDLAAGESLQILFEATADEQAPLNVTNWASAESFTSGGDPLPAAVSGARDDDPANAAMGSFALEIAKLPDVQQDGWLPGETVTWDIVISNPSDDTANTDLAVTDFLPTPLTYHSWSSTDPRVSLTETPSFQSGPNGESTAIDWTISDLAAGESVTIKLTAGVPETVAFFEWYVNDVQVTSNQVADLVANQAKARWYEAASLGDYTWLDHNGDGKQDIGDDPVDGIIVNLYDGAGNQLYRDPSTGAMTTNPDLGYPALSMTTGDNPDTLGIETGWYEFDNLPPGSYQVEFVPPAALTMTFSDQGSTEPGDTGDGHDSDADRLTGRTPVLILSPSEHNPTFDAGFVAADAAVNAIGDHTWIDEDRDGVQQSAPLDGVTVNLLGAGPDGQFGTDDDVILQSTVTGDDPGTVAVEAGWYRFSALPDGQYQVEFKLDPSNPAHNALVGTWEHQGSDERGDAGDSTDSDASRSTGRSPVIDLDKAGSDSSPVVDLTIDAGFFNGSNAVNEIGDTTWLDANSDGLQDSDESPLSGVVVALIDPDTGAVLATTMTDADGHYLFTNLPDGSYQVRFSLDPNNPEHAGLSGTFDRQGEDDSADSDADRLTGLSAIIDLDSGSDQTTPVTDRSIDAGFVSGDNSIGDATWIDADRNGQQDEGEAPLEGVLVSLYGPGPDGVTGTADDAVLATTVTDDDGWYEFAELPDGSYRLEFALDPDNPAHTTLVPTWEHQGSDDGDSDANRRTGLTQIVDLDSAGAALAPIVDANIDAGWFDDPSAMNEISDYTWIDLDGDGMQSAEEPPLSGVIVEIVDPATGEVLASTTTDEAGHYEFTGLPDGEYQVKFTLDPSNPTHAPLRPTFANEGDETSDGADSDADRLTGLTPVIDLDSEGTQEEAVHDTTIDAGFLPGETSSLGSHVWDDENRDGLQDSDEEPIDGVMVELWGPGPDGEFGSDDDHMIDSTVSDEAGFYEFTDLVAGDYRVRFDPTTLPDNYLATSAADCDCESSDSNGGGDGWTSTISLGWGVHDPDVDFGAHVADVDLVLAKQLSDTQPDTSESVNSVLVWDLSVSNTGLDPAVDPISLLDSLPATLEYDSATGDGWTCGSEANDVRCAYDGVLAPGEVAPVLQISTNVLAAPGTGIENTAQVLGTNGELALDNNTASAAATAPTPQPGLLAFTGSSLVRTLALVATLLLLAGVFFAWIGARREESA